MEGMVNKLANIDTDISTTRRLPDDLLKKVIDGHVKIDRKFKTAVEGRIPAVHIFGANQMPSSLEGGSGGAYDRRAVILRTETAQAGQGGGAGMSDWLWQQGRDGVLKMALKGLARLLSQGGIYSTPQSSVEAIKEWQDDQDLVKQFILSVEHGEVKVGSQTILVDRHAKISSKVLYQAFLDSVMEDGKRRVSEWQIPSPISFSKRLRQDKRFASSRTTVERLTSGLGFTGPGSGGDQGKALDGASF